MKFSPIPKFIRFGMVGTANTVIDLSILYVLIALFGTKLFPFYKGISFMCALLNSYFMNKRYTFQFKKEQSRTFLPFIFFSLVAFIINIASASMLFYALSSHQVSLSP